MSYLESLPLDVAYNILSQLYQSPKAKDHPRLSQRHQSPESKNHPYLTLSGVSKTLNGLVEAYCAHLLAARRARFPKAKHPQGLKGTNRQNLLQQIRTYCEFCNKRSLRRAVLACGLVCCKKCDQDEWPTKITMTDACKRYHLNKKDLFDAKIRYGTYFGVTGLTTLFLEHEVREVATRIHAGPDGDLAIYLALRASQSVERKAKQEEAREAKKTHLRRVLLANDLPDPTLVTKLSPLLSPVHNQRPAVSVLEAVRMHILEQRLASELGYRQSENGPSATASYIAWDHARAWDTRIIHTIPRAYSHLIRPQDPTVGPPYKQIHDSRDQALFEMFCREFGLFPDHYLEGEENGEKEAEEEGGKGAQSKEKQGSANRSLYRAHRIMWTSVPVIKVPLEMPRQAIIASGRRPRWETTIMKGQAPWSWARYPILVKDAVAEPAPGAAAAAGTADSKKTAEREKERKKIEKWNIAVEKEVDRITALVKERGVDIERWCKLKKPEYKVEEVEAADALQVLRGGREIEVITID